jgi:hypothetical protein
METNQERLAESVVAFTIASPRKGMETFFSCFPTKDKVKLYDRIAPQGDGCDYQSHTRVSTSEILLVNV